jgi:hypothetical protein
MTGVSTRAGSDVRPTWRVLRLAALACAALAAGSASAQEPQQAPPSQPPNFVDVIGRWLGDSKARIDEQIKKSTDAAKDAASKAGQATDAIVGLPGTRIVNGRERCTAAANGAPDCMAAANALCRAKGFANGRQLDVNTSERCPAWVYLSGRSAPPGTCTTDTFVTRAVCQ